MFDRRKENEIGILDRNGNALPLQIIASHNVKLFHSSLNITPGTIINYCLRHNVFPSLPRSYESPASSKAGQPGPEPRFDVVTEGPPVALKDQSRRGR